MASTGDQSWMYMLPIKKNSKKIDLPPISQIPGIGNADDKSFPPDFGGKNYVPGHMITKPTDTDYIILCKKGGRANLLSHRAFEPKSKDPVPYNRCDWFYQLDRDLEEKGAETEKHDPNVPPYMLHKEFVPSKLPPEQPLSPPPKEKTKKTKRGVPPAPYHVCSNTDWYRSFPRRKYFRSTLRHRHKQDLYSELRPLPQWGDYCDKTDMVKLIANTYQKEWTEKRKEWSDKLDEINKHNADIMKKINDKENSKTRMKPFDSVAWLEKSAFSNVCNPHRRPYEETIYQSCYCKPGFKRTLVIPTPKPQKVPFPTYQEDNSKIEFSKLISNQYAHENEKYAEKYKKDIEHYLNNRPKEKKQRCRSKFLK